MNGKMLVLASITVVALASVVLASPPVVRFLSPQGAGDNVYDPTQDPVTGKSFPLPKMDAFVKPIPMSRKTVVVIAGGCTSCSLHAIDPQKVLPSKGETYLFAYQSPVKELEPWMRDLPPGIRVVADSDLALRKAANSAWQPRYVVLDESHRLTDLSKDDAGVPEYVHMRGAR